jgi:hypothetical protein
MTVDEYLAAGGMITRCPPAICAYTTARLPPAALDFHIARWAEQERAKKAETVKQRRSRIAREAVARREARRKK